MKILAMKLTAYGPFTDVIMDLSAGQEGFHVIYGPNEAGKSSALRALRHLLYGIPVRSTDDFLHPYSKMRIGAAIQSGSGDVLEFVRLKGRRNTLRAADDRTVIADSVLNQYLAGVDGSLFETMFGIGYADLVRGGREIVQGGGNLGQVIFAAGSGVANLRQVQTDLQAEADALFRPAGQRPKINEALGLINKNRLELRGAQLPGQEWEKHYLALQQARDRVEIVASELKQNQTEMNRLKRIQEAFPIIAKRKELLEEFKEYAAAVLLPDEFPELRRDLLTKLGVSQSEQAQARKSIEAAENAIAKLEISDSILDNSDLIEEIYQELGTQRKASKDCIKLETLKDSLRGEARDILCSLRDDLTVDDAEQLRIKKAQAVRIHELGAAYERIATRIETSREAIPRLAQRISGIENQLKKIGAPVPVENLKRAVDQAEEYVAAEKHCLAERSDIQTAAKTLEAKISRQAHWTGSVEELERLAVPPLETVNSFEERREEADRSYRKIKAEHDRIAQELADLERQIEELRLQQEVPTEADLQKARGLRDRGWRLVLTQLEGAASTGEEVDRYIGELQPAGTLAEAFQTSLVQADEIADRLRREAGRVAAKAKLLADQTAHEKQLAHLKAEFDEAEKTMAVVDKEWFELWQPSGIAPRSPREMQHWIQIHNTMVEKATEIRVKKAKIAAMAAEITGHIKRLEQILQNFAGSAIKGDKTLGDLIKKARRIIEKEDKLRREQEQLEKEKHQRQQELADAGMKVKSSEKDLAQWQKDWEDAVRPLGLDANSVPPQANAVMDELKILFDKLKEADILQKRIQGIDRDADQFAKRVVALVDAVAKDLSGLRPEEAAVELNTRLTRAITVRSNRQTFRHQLSKEKRRLDGAVYAISRIETRLNAMCQEAGISSHEDLPDAERRSDNRRRIETGLQNLDERLLQLSGGATVADFIKEALQVDPDSTDGEINLLEEEINRLNQEKSLLDQTIGEERNELSKMDGSARAAELAEDIQIQMGRLENDIEQYARLKIASKVLSRAIERYRDKSQGPILNRATALFRQITLGSFEGVRAEFDDNGQPVLVGVRPDGSDIVTVDGMSDGTADQLYLALRLAGLEDYLDKNEPLPFVVDDILIKFDDDRAAAALQILADISRKTQVIFFTHHRHLVELAQKHIKSSVLIKHIITADD
ncbi:MAG: AAA family ATPase [Deltaproteobacteria bacterium]|nr:AAA family ATPase [Deltaproteobacteria bacterium]